MFTVFDKKIFERISMMFTAAVKSVYLHVLLVVCLYILSSADVLNNTTKSIRTSTSNTSRSFIPSSPGNISQGSEILKKKDDKPDQDGSCDEPSDCEVDNSLCISNLCLCTHGYFPHYDPGTHHWSCLATPVQSVCCVGALAQSAGASNVSMSDIQVMATFSLDPFAVQKTISYGGGLCDGGDDVCKARMGHNSKCDTTLSLFGSCRCHTSQGEGYYDVEESTCSLCQTGEYVNGSCINLLDEPCVNVSDYCHSHIGYNCLYNYKCSCAQGYRYNCLTKRCVKPPVDSYQKVDCPHIIQDHVIGTVSCDRRSGCWKVLGSKGATAGCVDMLISLLPDRCGITCKLEYQGYGDCEDTDKGIVCFSCLPSFAVQTSSSGFITVIIAIVSFYHLRQI